MVKNKKRKFKKSIRFVLMLLFLITIFIIAYKVYIYCNSYEYKLRKNGYTIKEISLIENRFHNRITEEQFKTFIDNGKIEYISELLEQKYFMVQNFEKYVSYIEEVGNNITDSVSIVNVSADKDWYSETKNSDTRDKNLVLVNKFNILEKTYVAENIKKFSTKYAYGNVYAEEECYNAFIDMFNAASSENITLILTSGYRSYDSQKRVYDEMHNKNGKEYADNFAARPGSSEHQTGLALDIFSLDGNTTETFKNSSAYAWLIKNADKYGFILRYPENKTYLTGYSPEAWHWRYLGPELATSVKKSGLTYDEYYVFYLSKK